MDTFTFPEPMPADLSTNTLIVRVMADHGITQRSLAEFLGYDRAFVTRMCNGTSAVTHDTIRVLYRITRDARLAESVADGGDTLLLDLTDSEITRTDVDLATLLIALNGVQAQAIDNLDTLDRDCPQFVRDIDTAIKHLLRVRRRVAAREPVPFRFRPARRIPDPVSA